MAEEKVALIQCFDPRHSLDVGSAVDPIRYGLTNLEGMFAFLGAEPE